MPDHAEKPEQFVDTAARHASGEVPRDAPAYGRTPDEVDPNVVDAAAEGLADRQPENAASEDGHDIRQDGLAAAQDAEDG